MLPIRALPLPPLIGGGKMGRSWAFRGKVAGKVGEGAVKKAMDSGATRFSTGLIGGGTKGLAGLSGGIDAALKGAVDPVTKATVTGAAGAAGGATAKQRFAEHMQALGSKGINAYNAGQREQAAKQAQATAANQRFMSGLNQSGQGGFQFTPPSPRFYQPYGG